MEIMKKIAECVVEGESDNMEALIQEGLDAGCAPADLINEGLLPGMGEVSELFKAGDLFVPEVLIAAQAMGVGMNMLKPLLVDGAQSAGKAIMLTVEGDLHDVGKNLCSIMMESAGFEVIDIGVDVSPEQAVASIKEYNPDLLGMSAMLTTTMESMVRTIELLKENGLDSKVKVMVGGAPLNDDYAEKVGAKYSADATGAVELAQSLMA